MNDEWWTGIIRLPILGSLLPPSPSKVSSISSEKKDGSWRTPHAGAGRFKLQALPDRNMRRGDWGVRSGWAGQVQTRRRPLATLERHVLGRVRLSVSYRLRLYVPTYLTVVLDLHSLLPRSLLTRARSLVVSRCAVDRAGGPDSLLLSPSSSSSSSVVVAAWS